MEQRTPDERAAEQTLNAFAPRSPRLDRDRLMFLAGQTSVSGAASKPSLPEVGRRAPWPWMVATTSLSGLSLALAAMLMVQAHRPPVVVVRNVIPEVPQTSTQSSAENASNQTNPAHDLVEPLLPADDQWLVSSKSSLLSMRQIALTRGVDSLPVPTAATSTASQPTAGASGPDSSSSSSPPPLRPFNLRSASELWEQPPSDGTL
jgi:hypothetical protein